MSLEPNIEAYTACTRKVLDNFLPRIQNSGKIAGESDILAYYHAPNLLGITGLSVEGHRVANWLAREVLTTDGDFRHQGSKGAIIKPSLQWNYINGWFVWGLVRLGRFDVSEPATKYIEKFQNTDTGGFFTAADPNNNFEPVPQNVDMGSTCASALAMIYSGRWASAIRACEFLLHALKAQSDEGEAFYCMFDTKGRAVTEFPDDQAYCNLVDFKKPMQAYWYFGFAARLLALMYRATGRKDLLQGSLDYIDLFERCPEDRWVHYANDKVAWASALLYQITRDPIHRERVARCFNPIVKDQREDGVWHWKALFPDYNKQPSAITTELALEFAFLLQEIVSEIESI